MAFETAEIRSTLDAITPINGYRQDAVVGNVVALSLVNLVGTPSTFKWELIGRPAFSVAGGAGVNPWVLSTSSTASFTVDGDAVARRDGSYIVRCTLNESSPTQRIIEVAICRVSGETIVGPAGAVALRKPGAFESLLDTFAVAPANLGYAPQLEHWLEALRGLIASGGGGAGTLSASYLIGAVTADQTLDLMDADGGAFIVDGTDGGFTGAFSLIAKHDAQTALLSEAASGEIERVRATTNLATAGYTSWWGRDESSVFQEAGRIGFWVTVGEGPALDDIGLEVRSESDLRFNIGANLVATMIASPELTMGLGHARLNGNTLDPFLSLTSPTTARLGTAATFRPVIGIDVDHTQTSPGATYTWRPVHVGNHILTLAGTGNTLARLLNVDLEPPQITASGGNSFTITDAANLYIADAPVDISANITLTNTYAIWVDAGLCRFDGDGTNVFQVPDDTGAVGAHYGRIPINIAGVGQKFIEILN